MAEGKIIDFNKKVEETKGLKIDLNERFNLFLKMRGLNKLPADEHRKMKQSFMAGCNEILTLLRVVIPSMTEKEGVEEMNKIVDQVNEYWNNQREKKY